MTSKNSSSIKTFEHGGYQRYLTGRRSWLSALSWLFYIIYYPAAVILINVSSRQNAADWGYTREEALRNTISNIAGWIGMEGSYGFLAVFLAMAAALSGYAYLNSSVRLDFIESQPMKRKTRFFQIFWNGILVNLIPAGICFILSILAAGAMGIPVFSSGLILEAGYQFLRLFLAYFSAYCFGILAVMLCGNLLIAGMGCLFFYGIEILFQFVRIRLRNIFYATFAEGDHFAVFMGSPLYNCFAVSNWTNGKDFHIDTNLADRGLIARTLIRATYGADVTNLCLGLAVLLAAFLLYKRRKAEYAGKSVIYAPVRLWVKLSLSILGALLAGLFVIDIIGRQRTFTATVICIVVMMAAAVAVGGIIEAVFAFDSRKFFRNTWSLVAAAAAAVLIFAGYRKDITGYDSYIPKEEETESAWIEVSSNYGFTFPKEGAESYVGPAAYAERQMKLTNIPDVIRFAEAAQSYTRENGAGAPGWNAVLGWRLKDGRTVTRSVVIPYDIDPDVMDAVTGTEGFRDGVFSFFTQEQAEGDAEAYLQCESPMEKKVCSARDYGEFLAAYREDLKSWNYSLTQNSAVFCNVTVSLGRKNNEDESEYPVYESFTNTIAFLKKEGIYTEPVWESEDVKQVILSQYDDETGEDTEYAYTGDVMKQILEAYESDSYSFLFERGGDQDRISVTLSLDGTFPDAEIYGTIAGSLLPEKAKEDLGE